MAAHQAPLSLGFHINDFRAKNRKKGKKEVRQGRNGGRKARR